MLQRLVPLLLLAAAAQAHIGSPDVFHEGEAGPYRLFVTIRPPIVVPGIAEIEIRAATPGVGEIRIVPLRLTGPGATLAPAPDVAVRSKVDPQFFSGSLWLMSAGAWQVRIHTDGEHGKGSLSVPVPALPSRTTGMQFGIGALLFGLMLILAIGIVSIAGASVREAQLAPGEKPAPDRLRRARGAMLSTALLVSGGIVFGAWWWNLEADAYGGIVYKPLGLKASLDPGDRLKLGISDPGWLRRRIDDLLPDHTHLMHLYVVRLPDMERVWHLHPEQAAPGVFEQRLPPMPSGGYQLFADIVHATGIPETMTAQIQLPDIAGAPLSGDDSAGSGPPLCKASDAAPLAGGGRIVWMRPDRPIRARELTLFRFRTEEADGSPATNLELYMGMQGHAAFLKSDRTVFAHVHPSGSVPMAALSLAGPVGNPHAAHRTAVGLPADVSFPYGLPQPGQYRVFVQIKRAGRVETGVFDVQAE